MSQSKKLIKLFKQMKDFIIQRQNVFPDPELVKLSMQTQSNTEEIQKIKQQMVTHDELAVVIKDFTDPNIKKDSSLRGILSFSCNSPCRHVVRNRGKRNGGGGDCARR